MWKIKKKKTENGLQMHHIPAHAPQPGWQVEDMLKINPKDKILGDLLAYPHCMNGETKVRELSTYRQMLASPE